MMSLRLFKYSLLSTLLVSCHEPATEGNKAERILKSADKGDFRGINIGDGIKDVKTKEDANSVYSMPDELIYRITPDDQDSTWYEISYNFNAEGLYNINLDVFPRDTQEMKQLRLDFMNYYSEKYGDCKFYDGYCQWRAMTQNGHIVSIVLADSLPQANRPRLRVNFNEFNEVWQK